MIKVGTASEAIIMRPPLILASQSARRVALLEQIGITVDRISPADIDETPYKNELPHRLASRLATEKAEQAINILQSRDELPKEYLLIAADTVVGRGRRILPKPMSMDDAHTTLLLLSGRSHKVYTNIVVCSHNHKPRKRLVETRVRFKRLSSAEIDDYITSGEWRGKAGGYAIQGLAARFVIQISGSYSNVVGLPLFETAQLLESAGFEVRRGWI